MEENVFCLKYIYLTTYKFQLSNLKLENSLFYIGQQYVYSYANNINNHTWSRVDTI